MSINRVYYLIVACLLATLSSCIMMGPQADPIALLQGKNDAMITAGISVPGSIAAATVSGSYAITDHFAVQAHAELPFYKKTETYPFYTDLGAGYYTKLKENVILENFYGGGYGHAQTYTSASTTGKEIFNSGRTMRAYTQVNCGMVNLGRAHTEFGGGLRIGYEGYHWIYQDTYWNSPEPVHEGLEEDDWRHSMLIEPIFFVRFGWEHWKIGLQLAGRYSLVIPSWGSGFGFDPSITLNYCF